MAEEEKKGTADTTAPAPGESFVLIPVSEGGSIDQSNRFIESGVGLIITQGDGPLIDWGTNWPEYQSPEDAPAEQE